MGIVCTCMPLLSHVAAASGNCISIAIVSIIATPLSPTGRWHSHGHGHGPGRRGWNCRIIIIVGIVSSTDGADDSIDETSSSCSAGGAQHDDDDDNDDESDGVVRCEGTSSQSDGQLS